MMMMIEGRHLVLRLVDLFITVSNERLTTWHRAEEELRYATGINNTTIIPSRTMKAGIMKSITAFMNMHKPAIKTVETFPARNGAGLVYMLQRKTAHLTSERHLNYN